MRFFNPSDNALNVQYIQLAAYWGASYEKNGNNITNVISRGTELTSVVDTKGFKIEPNSFVDVDFFLETKWLNLLSSAFCPYFRFQSMYQSIASFLLSHGWHV